MTFELDEKQLSSDAQKAELERLIEASYPRNVVAAVLWESFWGIGAACCLLYAVVPAYLLYLGASKITVQLVTMWFSLSTVLQLLSIRMIHGARRKIQLYLLWSLFAILWMAYGITAILGWGRLPDSIWMALFVLMCIGLAIPMHLGSPAYGELLVENTPLKKRGRFGSMRSLALGICGIIGVQLTAWLMKQWPEPVNFHASFIIGSGIMLFSCFSILFLHDNVLAMPHNGAAPPSAIKAAKNLLRNFNFRVFLVFYALLFSGQTLGPLLIGYGRDILAIQPSEMTNFSAAFFFGPIIVGGLISPLADRYGFRLIAIISAAMLALAFILPLAIPHNRFALFTAYAMYSGSIILNFMILANLGVELVPSVKPGVIIAVGSAIVVPLGLGIATLGGRLADVYHEAGYLAVLVMGMTFSICAMIGFRTVVREPRTGQEIYVRIRRV